MISKLLILKPKPTGRFMNVAAQRLHGSVSDEWSAFKVNFNKTYRKAEENERRKIFEENLLEIKENNKKYEEGLVSYKLGINKFADLKSGELSNNHYTEFAYNNPLQYEQLKIIRTNYIGFGSGDDVIDIPKSIDWRKKGAVTDVKDQTKCGSCWAFSAAGVIEGQMARKTGRLVSLSAQQLVDCETLLSRGCGGGDVFGAYIYAHYRGLMTNQDYPYKAIQSDCKGDSADKSNRVFVQSYYGIKPSSENLLKATVGLIGPISVILRMDSHLIKYQEGIYSQNSQGVPNHAVLLVGYDKDKKTGEEFWIIKNSYGTAWGENGYLRLLMGKNLRGITTNPSFATYDEQRSMPPK